MRDVTRLFPSAAGEEGTGCGVTSSSCHTCSDTGNRGRSTNPSLGCRMDPSPLVSSAGEGFELSLGVYTGCGVCVHGVLSLSVNFGNNHG